MLIFVFSLFGVVMGCSVRLNDTKCDEGWTYIQRDLGGYCVKIFESIWDCSRQGGWDSTVESLEELDIYLNLLKKSGEKYATILAAGNQLCYCGQSTCPITETCKPPSVWSHWDTPIEVLEKVEPSYLNETKYGQGLSITTENESGLTDNMEGLENRPSLCGKKAT